MKIKHLLSLALVLCGVLSTSSASAGLTILENLEGVFTSNTFTASSSGQILGSDNVANVVATGDLVRSVVAFNSADNYAALVWLGRVSDGGLYFPIGNQALQSSQVQSHGFSNDTTGLGSKLNGLNSGVYNGGAHAAYLIVADDSPVDFKNQTFSTIQARTDLQLAAAFDIVYDSGASSMTFDSYVNTGTLALTYSFSLNLVGVDSTLTAPNTEFFNSLFESTNEARVVSNVPSQSYDVSFTATDATHSWADVGSSTNSVTFNTIAAVPEPNTLLVFSAVGFAGLAARRRRS